MDDFVNGVSFIRILRCARMNGVQQVEAARCILATGDFLFWDVAC